MKNILGLLAICLLIGACASSTPQGRIEANPEKFASLSSKHKALVQEGKIDRGMPKDGVLLAWGTPSGKFDGYENRRRTERWDYSGSRPVVTSGVYGGYGYSDYWGYGYGRYHPYGVRFAVGPEVVYVPYTRASVTFANERVDSWERAR
jgi:hypothetical protein